MVSKLAGTESRKKNASADKLFLGFTFTVNLMWIGRSQLCSVKQTVALKIFIFKKLHMSMHYHDVSLWPATERSRHIYEKACLVMDMMGTKYVLEET